MNTSWQSSSKWYNRLVGDQGHYYHEHIILPNVLKLLNLNLNSKILDIGCGQGILAKKINPQISYVGIDLAKSLIEVAQKSNKNPNHKFLKLDATKPLNGFNSEFTHAVAILSLQNMENLDSVIKNVANVLKEDGKFILVLNHPAFRIPRQSGWGIAENKIQYRYVNNYMSDLKIPIQMHPGEKSSEITWSFHHPISYYFKLLKQYGFLVEDLQEWVSDKKSEEGKVSKMENHARAEIPLFMTLVAIKK